MLVKSVALNTLFESSKSSFPAMYFLVESILSTNPSSSRDLSIPKVVLLLMASAREISVTPRGFFSLTISLMISNAFFRAGALYIYSL